MTETSEATRPQRPVRRPSPWLLAAEGPRAFGELALLQTAWPWLASAPRGDGHQVLVLPGLGAGDRSTAPLRGYLARLGYDVHGWGLGRNVPSTDLIDRLRQRVRTLLDRADAGASTSLVGWSLGGIYAREIAERAPDQIRQVVTLGSPFRSAPNDASNVDALRRRFARGRATDGGRRVLGDDVSLPVPSTAVFSRSDGIVPWRACVDVTTGPHETLEVTGSHCGLGHHPAVLWIVANRLDQPPGSWAPMTVPTPLQPFIRRHDGR